MLEKILIAHDGSGGARKALDTAVELAVAQAIDEVTEANEEDGRYFAQLAAQCRRRAAPSGIDLQTSMIPGHEVKAILEFAREGLVQAAGGRLHRAYAPLRPLMGRHVPEPHQHGAAQRAGGEIDLPLVGFHRERERVAAAARAREPLMLPGPPGCGKTRLLRNTFDLAKHAEAIWRS